MNSKYVLSKYNLIIPNSEDNENITIYNTANESIINLEKKVFDLLSKNDCFDDDVPYFKELYKQGIVVNKETNEYEAVMSYSIIYT